MVLLPLRALCVCFCCCFFYEAICFSFAWYYFVLVFFSPLSIAITSLGEERANLSVFRTFVRFALVWFCLFPLPLGVWEGLRLVIVALPGLFSYPFFTTDGVKRRVATVKESPASPPGGHPLLRILQLLF